MPPLRFHLATALLALATAMPAQSPPAGFTYETLVDGPLQEATAMAFLPDGRLLITERATGNIRVFSDGALDPTPWATIPVYNGGAWAEAGLLGIAVDPDFLNNHYVYVHYCATSSENVVARLEEVGGAGTNLTVLTPAGAIAAADYHNAGPMLFGFDGKLYVTTGDALAGLTAQDLNSWRGKILRFDVPDLTIPADNPFAGSAIYSYGHRNQFGLSLHPISGDLYQTENGGGWQDEVNRILPGGNYGWPIVEGQETTPNPLLEDPLAIYHPTSAPTGCCFYTGEHYPAVFHNAWFFTNYNDNQLSVIWFDANGSSVVSQALFDDLPGAGYAVTTGPDGNLWYLTNDSGGYGADELGRYVHQNEGPASMQLSSVSNKTLGASLTVCVHGMPGGVAVPWLSMTRFAGPISTLLGNLWVPGDVVLPTTPFGNDGRCYLPIEVPNVPAFLGSSVHGQAVVLTPATTFLLSNPTELVIRG